MGAMGAVPNLNSKELRVEGKRTNWMDSSHLSRLPRCVEA